MRNACVAWDDIAIANFSAATIYNKAKNAGCTKVEFKKLSFKDFISIACIAAHHKLKYLFLAPHYHAQMDCCTRKWDCRDNEGAGDEVVDTCHQLVGSSSIGIYNSMANVQETVRILTGNVLPVTDPHYRP